MYSSLFVKATIKIANGTIFPGTVAIRCQDRAVYSVSLFLDSEEYDFHLILKDQFQGALSSLLQHLNTPVKQVLPLSYSTQYRFEDGATIAGVIREDAGS